MLTKIAIFNSTKHAKAIITLDKSSIQLVGENQIGKTSLIDAFNFLYVIKKQNMSFDNGKYTYAQTLDHLFPSEQQSFIIFETFKKAHSYFCILVKRKFDDVEYYKINLPLDDIPVFKPNNQIRTFQELEEYFVTLGSGIYTQLDRLNLFKLVYSSDQTKNAVVWLNNNVSRVGQSLENSFTEVYRYLINSKLISADTLQEALIIANDRKNTNLKIFADSTKKESITKLKKLQTDIDNFSGVKQSFELFKEIVMQYNLKSKFVGKQYFTFVEYMNLQKIELQEQINNLETQSENSQTQLEDEENGLETRKTILSKETGTFETEIKQKNSTIETSNQILREIQQINMFNLSTEDLIKTFNTQKETEEKKAKEIEYYLQNAQKLNRTEQQVKKEIENSTKQKNSLENQIKNQVNLLIFNITDDKEKQKLLNTILSEEILNLSKEKIIKSITNFSENLQVFDGEIIIDKIKLKPIKTIDELKAEFEQVNTSLTEDEKVLKIISDLNKSQSEFNALQTKIENLKKDIAKVALKEPNEQIIKTLTDEIGILTTQLDEKNIQLDILKKEISEKRKIIKSNNEKKAQYEKIISSLKIYDEEFLTENIQALPCEIVPIADLEIFVRNLLKEIKALNELKTNKLNRFNELKIKLNRNYSDELEFIKSVGEEIDSLQLREKAKEELLRNISEQIIHPVFDYLKYYRQFKKDFISSFNREISNYKISKIHELKIEIHDKKTFIDELELITKVQKLDIGKLLFDLNDLEQKKGIEKLDEYLNTSKSRIYEFSELFEIKIKVVYQDGTFKTIDLRKQDESTGTIRMINLIVFLLVIKYFKVNAEDNKIVFFVDELSIDQKNIGELIDFCKENGFITIFAANQQGIGIEKYYLMKPSPENENRVVLDETHTGKIRKRDE